MTTKTRSHLVRHRAALVLAGLFAGVVLAACGSSSADSGTGNTGPSDAEFTQLKNEVADLKQQVASLTATLETLSGSVNVVVARNGATARTMMKGGAATALKLGDGDAIGCAPSGYLPSSQFMADYIQCTTPQGYLVDVPKEGGPPRWVNAWYESTNCTGTAYVRLGEVRGAHSQGAVFEYLDGVGSHVGYFPPAASLLTRTVGSVYSKSDGCETLASTRIEEDVIEVVPHDADPETGVSLTTGAMDEYPPTTVVTQ